jgi:hypothetical protein
VLAATGPNVAPGERRDKTKSVAFKLWYQGKSLREIQVKIAEESDTQAGSVRGWVLDWERGNQKSWAPRVR